MSGHGHGDCPAVDREADGGAATRARQEWPGTADCRPAPVALTVVAKGAAAMPSPPRAGTPHRHRRPARLVEFGAFALLLVALLLSGARPARAAGMNPGGHGIARRSVLAA